MRTKPGLKPQLSTPDIPEHLHAHLCAAVGRFLVRLRDDTITRLRAQARVIHDTPDEATVASALEPHKRPGQHVQVDNPLGLFSPADWATAVGDEIGPLIGAVVVDAANRAVIGASFDVSDPAMVAAVTDHVRQMQQWGPALQFQVANTVTVGMSEGWSVDRIASHLTDVGPLSDTAARQIGHDVAIASSNAGTLTSWRDAGGVQTKTWLNAGDDRVRDSHQEAGDTQVDIPIDQPFTVGGEQCDYPGDPSLSPAESANCVLPDTIVDAWDVSAGFRRYYSGEVVTIATAAGYHLSATPNHPVLTTQGWIAVGLLVPGDNVLSRCHLNRPGRADPHIADCPIAIAEVFDALADSGTTNRIPGLAVHFHGDGSAGEVDIVRPNGVLSDRTDRLEPTPHLGLPFTNETGDLRSAAGPSRQLGGTAVTSSAGGISSSSQGAALIDRCQPHSPRLLFRASPNRHLPPLQPTREGQSGDACLISEGLRTLAREVAPDEIISVSRRVQSTHIYNLETYDSLYIGNGVVVSNCRCSLLAGLDDSAPPDEATVDDGDQSEEDASDGGLTSSGAAEEGTMRNVRRPPAEMLAAFQEGNADALIKWYNDGADGQINWCSPGDFEDCVGVAGDHLDNPEGFCERRHEDVCGGPPGSEDQTVNGGEKLSAGCGCDDEAHFGSTDSSVSDKSWDGSASRFSDDQYKMACAACDPGDGTVKERCFLPHHEPGGATNRNGVHAAAQRVSSLEGHSSDAVATAKSHLRSHYSQLGEKPPKSIAASAENPARFVASPDPSVNTGAMIALYPDSPDTLTVDGDGAYSPDELHCTVLYLGKAADLTDAQLGALREAVESFASGQQTVTAIAEAVSLFGDDENGDGQPDCLVAILNGAGLLAVLEGLRDPARAVCQQNGLDLPDTHPVWVPHMTVAEGTSDTTPAEGLVGRTVTFSTVSLVMADDRTDFRIGQNTTGGTTTAATKENRMAPNQFAPAATDDSPQGGASGGSGDPFQPAPYERQPDETVECPACNLMNDPDASFCDQCGASLVGMAVKVDGTEVPSYDPQPYRVDDGEDVQCPNCELMDDEDAQFCDQCGAKLAGNPDVMIGGTASSDGGDGGSENGGGGNGGGGTPVGTMPTAAGRTDQPGTGSSFEALPGDQWKGVLIVEDVESGDERMIAAGALTWRELPLPLMLMTRNPEGGMGHDGADLCGQITQVWRDGNEIWGSGTFDLGCAAGVEAQRLVAEKQLRGVSADLDKVTVDFENPDPFDDPDAGLEDLFEWDPGMLIVTEGRLMGGTLTPFPAFEEASIQLIDSESGDEIEPSLVASGAAQEGARPMVRVMTRFDTDQAGYALVASAGGIPVTPPAAWFARQGFDGPTPVRVSKDGRVTGHALDWNAFHIGVGRKAPRSRCNYAYYRCGQVITQEGTAVATGPLVMDTVHPNLKLRASDAQAFYADTGCAVADVACYEDEWGLQLCGAVRPQATPEQVRALRGSDFSPDWRPQGGHLEMVALLAVNNGGFKVPASLAASAGNGRRHDWVAPGRQRILVKVDTGEPLALVAAGMLRRSDTGRARLADEVASLREQVADLAGLVRPLRAQRAKDLAAKVAGGTRAARKERARAVADQLRR